MLYYFLYYLPHIGDAAYLRLFKYLSFRSGGAILTALFIAFWIGPGLIAWLKVKQGKGQPIRTDGPQRHVLEKKGTPTMGGLLILISVVISTILWADVTNWYVWIVLFVTVSYGALGFADDYVKVTKRSPDGVSGKVRLLFEFGVAFIATYFIMALEPAGQSGTLAFPFFKSAILSLGFAYIAVGGLVIAGAANAVNFTDGLDGLAIMPVMIAAGAFFIIAYMVGNEHFATYLQLVYVPDTAELAVIFSAGLFGAGLGFLWYNAPPAAVFMGDTGSLALGGALGAMAVCTKHEIVLAIVGGLFVVEALSVIIQVLYYKATKKRIFLMAPIHHHFEKKGWAEPQIVIRFWIISLILAAIGLATLKIR